MGGYVSIAICILHTSRGHTRDPEDIDWDILLIRTFTTAIVLLSSDLAYYHSLCNLAFSDMGRTIFLHRRQVHQAIRATKASHPRAALSARRRCDQAPLPSTRGYDHSVELFPWVQSHIAVDLI
jgi:hypothetical protein